MESATRKRKSCSEEESEPSTSSTTQVKTRRRLENPNSCSDRVSAATPTPIISGNKLASENVDAPEEVRENEVTVEFAAESTGDGSCSYRGERRSHVEGEQAVVEEEDQSTMGSTFMTERMLVTADEFKRSFLANVENMRKQFIDKYNFDIVKDEPLEGQYEWVRINQKNKP